MQETISQPPSRNRRFSSLKLPIMHLIGNSWDSVSWSGFCVKTDTVPRLPRSSGVFQGSLRFTCEDAFEKKEISKLEGEIKMRYKNPNFPTTSDFEFNDAIVDLKRLPSHHSRCEYRFLWFLNTHVPKLFGLSASSGFSEAIGLRRYVEGSVVR